MVAADPQMSPNPHQHADQQTASWLEEAVVNYKVPPGRGALLSPLVPFGSAGAAL